MHQLPAAFQTVVVRVSVLRRARGAVSLLRSAPPAPLRLRHDDPSAGPHRGHRQLRLLQPADDLARRAPSGRRGLPEALACFGHRRRRERGSRPLAALDPRARRRRSSSPRPRCRFSPRVGLRGAIPRPLVAVYRAVAPLRSANGYGLFAVMTTSRPEIVLEGSEDGATWKPYEFRWKPGDPLRRPRFVAPHQPRLDWQMWFAALGDYRANPWLVSTMARLRRRLAGGARPSRGESLSPSSRRASSAPSSTTTGSPNAEERRRTGAWWKRELRGLYAPVLGGR